jgi:hypothetical protein
MPIGESHYYLRLAQSRKRKAENRRADPWKDPEHKSFEWMVESKSLRVERACAL